jgi:hypothetical protein
LSAKIHPLFYGMSMTHNPFTHGRLFASLLASCVFAFNAAAQSGETTDAASSWAMYFLFFAALIALGGCYYFWKKSKPEIQKIEYNYESRYKDYYKHGSYELGDLDADKELEWLRKSKKVKTKARQAAQRKLPRIQSPGADGSIDTREFQERMKKLQYAQLPINSFNNLAPARDFQPLPISNDEGLLTAIEQVNEEYEEDETVRELAVRILAAFRTVNSVEALYQVALYDLSANLRSKAVSILADFDHETVFEAILLACADPTREVRAAAARGLFKLNFDRSGAWTRLIETGDDFRMRHAVRAAVEAGIVHKSFDRLLHDDMKIAYEAFCLVALMIRSGEDKEIFEALREHKDERVKFSLLHVIRTIKDERTLKGLTELYASAKGSKELLDRTREVIDSFEKVTA